MALLVVEDDLEQPIVSASQGHASPVPARRAIAVADALYIAIDRTPRIIAVAAVAFVGLGEIDAGGVLSRVVVQRWRCPCRRSSGR